MTEDVKEVFDMLSKYWSGVVITQKINSPTFCLDFDQSANSDSPWFGKGRFHNSSPYISSITEIVNKIPEDVHNDNLQHLQNTPKTIGLSHTPSDKYFIKENRVIMIFHKNHVTSYPYTLRAAKKLGMSVSPVLFKGVLESEGHLKSLINKYKTSPNDISKSVNETHDSGASIVIRPLSSFRLKDYYNNVFEF
ncbi:MAG: hypothetical protein FWH54_00905 [Methanobrevibacter sp.]|nr:hypothetical protein [Methanobrevibacter sp.]